MTTKDPGGAARQATMRARRSAERAEMIEALRQVRDECRTIVEAQKVAVVVLVKVGK